MYITRDDDDDVLNTTPVFLKGGAHETIHSCFEASLKNFRLKDKWCTVMAGFLPNANNIASPITITI